MRILMVLENEFPHDERVEKEALSLIAAGHELYFICTTIADKPEFENYQGIPVHRVKSSYFLYKKARVACLTSPFYFSFWKKVLSDITKKEHFDAIHIHDLPLAKIGIDLAKKYNLKLVVDFHENYPYMLKEELYVKTLVGRIVSPIGLWYRYERKVLNQLDNAIVVCDEMGRRIREIAPIKNVFVLENVIDLKRWPDYQPISKEADTLKLLYVGGMTSKRGLETVVEGIALYNKSTNFKAHFYLYGSGKPEYLSALQSLANENGVSDFVHFEGYLRLPEDANKITQYDLGVIPHLRSVQTDNSSPNKLYQYLRYKLPVLCSDCDSLTRVIDEVNGGVVYKAGDAFDLSQKLSLFIDANKREQWGELGAEGVLGKYNWENAQEALVQLYSVI